MNFQKSTQRIRQIVSVVLIVLSVVLMSMYTREGESGILHWVQSGFHSVFAPVEFIGSQAGARADDLEETISDSSADSETLSALKERIEELTQLVTQSEEYRLENERLQGLLNLKETYGIEGVSGRVIGRSTDSWNQTITIDIGSSSGVEEGLTVIGPTGVVGQVLSVAPGSATVRLLSDPKSGAAAMVQSSRADGIVRGSLSGVLYLENVSVDVELKSGDVVLTSGLGGSYTKGLLIGTIVRVDGNAKDGTRKVVITPNERAAVLEEVTVVFSAKDSSQAKAPSSSSGGSDASASSAGSQGGSSVASSSSSVSSSSASSNASSSASSNGQG